MKINILHRHTHNRRDVAMLRLFRGRNILRPYIGRAVFAPLLYVDKKTLHYTEFSSIIEILFS